MVLTLGIGSLMIMGNMIIQVLAVVVLVRMFTQRVDKMRHRRGFGFDVRVVSTVVLVLFAGHVLQFATWAMLFVWLDQFDDFATAFYHSTVNFTSLGYGDIVMTPEWRLLGGLEAANGVLMFGLSAGTLLSVMNRLFNRHVEAVTEQRDHPA